MKLWLDIDDLFYFAERSARPTGIQRLTGEVYTALVERYPLDVGFVCHDVDPGLFRVVSWAEVREAYERLTGDSFPPRDRAEPPRIEILPQPQPASFFARLMGKLGSQATEAKTLAVAPVAPAAAVASDDLRNVAGRDDVLCALGAPWHDANYGERVAQLKRATGMRFAMLVHDLIPLVRPEYFEAGRAPNFGTVMAATLPIADIVLTNSKSTAADVVKWAGRRGISLCSTPRHVPIGTGFKRPPPGILPSALAPNDYVLFVSTIEIRKNHLQAFRIWCRMLQEMPRHEVPTLVFAGGWGWMVEDLRKAIESTNGLDGKLVVISEPSDATLSALYQNCRFTLFLSYYEGWGLPVSDSLSFGKVCIASQRTSMPEAGGTFCVYVDPDNTSGAFEKVKRLVERPEELHALEEQLRLNFQPVEWRVTADAVRQAVMVPSVPADADTGLTERPVASPGAMTNDRLSLEMSKP